MWIYEKKLMYPVKASGPNPLLYIFLLYAENDSLMLRMIANKLLRKPHHMEHKFDLNGIFMPLGFS